MAGRALSQLSEGRGLVTIYGIQPQKFQSYEFFGVAVVVGAIEQMVLYPAYYFQIAFGLGFGFQIGLN